MLNFKIFSLNQISSIRPKDPYPDHLLTPITRAPPACNSTQTPISSIQASQHPMEC